MPDYGIRLKKRDSITTVTLDRPERLNVFDEFMFAELERVTAEIKADLPRAVILTGSGDKAFSAGFDVNPDNPMVNRLIDAVSRKEPGPVEEMIVRLRKAVDDFVRLPIPIIAALNGLAYGGGAELAVRCDLRVMDPGVRICFAEVQLGLMPDWGGGATLARLIGPSAAADLVLTARKVTAEEAFQIGLINRISTPGLSFEAAVEVAEAIAKNGPHAVRAALGVIRESASLALPDALDLEAKSAVQLITTGECVHGIAAFLEKKDPVFPDPE